MFQDDLDIDEILNISEPTNSLKRFNTDFPSENLSKRPKINPVTPPENARDPPKQTTVKKLFRFKKKETVPNQAIGDVVKIDVNKATTDFSAGISHELHKNEVNDVPIHSDCKPIGDSRSLVQSEVHQNEVKDGKISRFNTEYDTIIRSNSETFSSGLNNIDQYAEKHSRIENDRSIFKRRFPGPAGLLPERNLSNSSLENFIDSSRIEMKEEICSQSSFVHFNEQTWEEMKRDFKTQGIHSLEKYNIQWIKSRTLAKKLINQKTPFLAAYIDSICSHSIQNPIVNVVLKDKTGTIQGTILHNLYEEHLSNLTIGSIVVLKEIGVLNTGLNDEPYLTITRNNLVSIYSNKKKTLDCSPQSSCEILKTVLQNIDADEILNRINETKRLHKIKNTNRTVESTYLMNKDVTGPKNLSDTFRKVIRNTKSTSCSETPNLKVLKIKSSPIISSTSSAKESVNNLSRKEKEKENIEDIREFFDSQEGLNEFFNDEPIFCSTQKGTFDNKNSDELKESRTEICGGGNQETSRIFEDIFEGVDASALFDEF